MGNRSLAQRRTRRSWPEPLCSRVKKLLQVVSRLQCVLETCVHSPCTRLLPYLYPKVRLTDTGMAADFVDFMLERGRPRNVQELYIGRLVNAVQAADVISECHDITTLTIRYPFWPTAQASRDLLLQPLKNLHNLKSLSIALVTLTDETEIDLSEFRIFHQLTHLHLIVSPASCQIVPEGLSKLPNLTHLSLHWSQSGGCIACLRRFLAQPSSRILVLWVPGIVAPERLERRLVEHRLVDRRVVLFTHERYNEYMRRGNGGFWQYAERLVAWRVAKDSKYNSLAVERGLTSRQPTLSRITNGSKSRCGISY